MADTLLTDDELLRIATTLGLPFAMLDSDYCLAGGLPYGTRSYGEVTCDGMVQFARAVLAEAVPPGYKVVPREPLPSQRIAGAVALMKASDSDLDCTTDEIAATYRAMIQAAPERTP